MPCLKNTEIAANIQKSEFVRKVIETHREFLEDLRKVTGIKEALSLSGAAVIRDILLVEVS